MTDTFKKQEITISGKAYNAKAGAVLMVDEKTPVYIQGMEEWDDDLIGESVKLTGVFIEEQIYPQTITEAGVTSQGMSGTPKVLKLTKPFKR